MSTPAKAPTSSASQGDTKTPATSSGTTTTPPPDTTADKTPSGTTADKTPSGTPTDKTPAPDSSTSTPPSGEVANGDSSPSTINNFCQKVVPITAAVVVAAIAIPLIKNCCDDDEKDAAEETKVKVDEKIEESADDQKSIDIGQSIQNFFKKILSALNLNKSAPLSDGPAFTVSEFGSSESS